MSKASLFLSLSLLPLAACGHEEWNCIDPGIYIPAYELPSDVVQLTLGGTACEHANLWSTVPAPSDGGLTTYATVDGFAPHGFDYGIMAPNGGECVIHIVLEDGKVIDRTIHMRQEDEEPCPGVYAEGGAIWVPEAPDAA